MNWRILLLSFLAGCGMVEGVESVTKNIRVSFEREQEFTSVLNLLEDDGSFPIKEIKRIDLKGASFIDNNGVKYAELFALSGKEQSKIGIYKDGTFYLSSDIDLFPFLEGGRYLTFYFKPQENVEEVSVEFSFLIMGTKGKE